MTRSILTLAIALYLGGCATGHTAGEKSEWGETVDKMADQLASLPPDEFDEATANLSELGVQLGGMPTD